MSPKQSYLGSYNRNQQEVLRNLTPSQECADSVERGPQPLSCVKNPESQPPPQGAVQAVLVLYEQEGPTKVRKDPWGWGLEALLSRHQRHAVLG